MAKLQRSKAQRAKPIPRKAAFWMFASRRVHLGQLSTKALQPLQARVQGAELQQVLRPRGLGAFSESVFQPLSQLSPLESQLV
jgi:hypothetical protein